jgi:hypothetical protein
VVNGIGGAQVHGFALLCAGDKTEAIEECLDLRDVRHAAPDVEQLVTFDDTHAIGSMKK